MCNAPEDNHGERIPEPWLLQFVDSDGNINVRHNGAAAYAVPKYAMLAAAALALILFG